MILRHKCKWASSVVIWACKFLSRACRAFPWEKGWCLGAWEPFPSSGRSLLEVSSTQGSLPKMSRHCSIKVSGTEFTWQPAELEHLDTALFAQYSLCSDGEQLGWGCSCPLLGLCRMHMCSSRGPVSTMLRHGLCSPASCQSTCTLLMKAF